MKAILTRKFFEKKQTLGEFCLIKNGRALFKCKTLELPWLNNKKQKSCIPAGKYKITPRFSLKFKNHFHVEGVSGRSCILIHSGNFYTNTRGCILVGNKIKDINDDGFRDVVNSKKTLSKLLKVAPEGFEMIIK